MAYFLTSQGLKDLQNEHKKITEADLPNILDSINVARQEGDLKENAGYQTALKVKDELTTRLQEIEEVLNDYQIIEESSGSTKSKKVQIGSTVKVAYLDLKEDYTVKIVGTSESDVLSGKISNESPLAVSIMGKKQGATVKLKSPNGNYSVKIEEIV